MTDTPNQNTPDTLPADFFSQDAQKKPDGTPDSLPADFFSSGAGKTPDFDLKKAVAGPSTVLGTIASKDAGAAKGTPYEGYAKIGKAIEDSTLSTAAKENWKQFGHGAVEMLHGNLRSGAHTMWQAAAPHIYAGSDMEKQMQALNPEFKGEAAPVDDRDNVFEKPTVDVGQFIDKDKHPMMKAVAETASSLTSPENLAIIAGTDGFGAIASPAKIAMANKLLSAGFAAQAIGSMYQHSEEFKKAYDEGNISEALYQMTHAVLSGAMTTMATAHALDNPLPLASKADLKMINRAKGTIGDVFRKPFSGDSLQELYYKLSNPGKAKGMKIESSIDRALPALKEVVDENPDVRSPRDMVESINQYRGTIDARILSRAESLRGQPETQMTGISDRVMDAIDKAFDETEGHYTEAEKEAAKDKVMNLILREEHTGASGRRMAIGPEGKLMAEPDLFELENVRQRFNRDTAPSMDTTKEPVPAAVHFAETVASNIAKSDIDAKYDELGIEGVKEWRQQEAGLIDVRDQIAKAQDAAIKRGQFSAWKSFINQVKWHSLVTGLLAGHQFGPEAGFGLGLANTMLGVFAEWMYDRKTNPNTILERIVNKTLDENKLSAPGAATPNFNSATPGTISSGNPPASPAPGANGAPPIGHMQVPFTADVEAAEVPGGTAQDVPGGGPRFSAQAHELAHAIVGHIEGLKPIDVIGAAHPELNQGSAAATRFDNSHLKTDGMVDYEKLRDHLHGFLTMLMAGAASDELFHETPREGNRHITGDQTMARQILTRLGFTPEEAAAKMDAAFERAKGHLQNSDVSDMIKQNSRAREVGLPDTHHYSAGRIQQILREVSQKVTNEARSNKTRTGSSDAENGVNTKPPTEGGSPSAPGRAASDQVGKTAVEEETEAEQRLPKLGLTKVPSERTTGPENDKAIKAGGGIPGGIQKGDEELNIPNYALFHDPSTGSSGMLPEGQITPERVKEELNKIRKPYVAAEDKRAQGDVATAADEFNRRAARPPVKTETAPISPEFSKRVADEYDAMKHDPSDPKVQATYQAFKNDVKEQWDYAVNHMGVKFEPWTKEGQPYANSKEMVQDVKNNKHLYFFQGGDFPEGHPMMEVDPKSGLNYNDMFRAVHDLFGHAAQGNQFGPKGEEVAYQLHRQMFSPEAVPALTSETRGQNSWVNFGKHMRNDEGNVPEKGQPGYVPQVQRTFATQKAGVMPEATHVAEPTMNLSQVGKSKVADPFEKAVGHYGVTDDVHKAGFIGPDGRMLDFSDGHVSRILDHGDISTVHDTENPRQDFVADTGSVRILHSPRQNYVGLHFDLEHPPTDAQLDRVLPLLKKGTMVEADISSTDTEKSGMINPHVGSGMAEATDLDSLRRVVNDARKDAVRRIDQRAGSFQSGIDQVGKDSDNPITTGGWILKDGSFDGLREGELHHDAAVRLFGEGKRGADALRAGAISVHINRAPKELVFNAPEDTPENRAKIGNMLLRAPDGTKYVSVGFGSDAHDFQRQKFIDALQEYPTDNSLDQVGKNAVAERRAGVGGVVRGEYPQESSFANAAYRGSEDVRTSRNDMGYGGKAWLDTTGKYNPQDEIHQDLNKNLKAGNIRIGGLETNGKLLVHVESEPNEAQLAALAPDIKAQGGAIYDILHNGKNFSGEVLTPGDFLRKLDSVFNSPDRISTRLPSGAKATENPLEGKPLTVELNAAPDTLRERFANKARDIAGVKVPKNITDPNKVIDRFVRHVADNLKFVHDLATPEERAENKQWYDSANGIAKDIASRYNDLKPQQTAGTIAALSPQMPWDMNVSLAKRLVDIIKLHDEEPATQAMMDKAKEIVNSSRVADPKANAALHAIAESLKGKTYKELTDPYDKAVWIRLFDETYNPRTFERIDPATGQPQEVMTSKNGSPTDVAWGNLRNVTKAISIVEDGSRENISNSLGRAHKVRNFFNNIIDPSNNHDVTIDTHAVGAGLLQPVSGNSQVVKDNFGKGAKTSHGLDGTYAMYAEGYRLAAKELGLKPRELQSIVWEKARKLFPEDWKTDETREHVESLWKKYENGNATLDQTRNEIVKYAVESQQEAQGGLFEQPAQNPLDYLQKLVQTSRPKTDALGRPFGGAVALAGGE